MVWERGVVERSRTEPKWNEGKRKEVEEERGEVETGVGGGGWVRCVGELGSEVTRERSEATHIVGVAARYRVVVDDDERTNERTNTDDLLAECKLASCL